MSEESRKIRLVKSINGVETEFEPAHDRRLNIGGEDKNSTPDLVALRLSNMGKQADILQNLINELKSMSDLGRNAELQSGGDLHRGSDNYQNEFSQLQLQIKEKEQILEARELALRELETAFKVRIEKLEKQLDERQSNLVRRESELARLTAKVHGVAQRLNQTEAETQARAKQFESTMATLKGELVEKESRLADKDVALQKLERELTEKIKELEVRLEAAEADLQSRAAEIKEKEVLIQAAMVKEAEIGKLIAHLSSECERLTAELNQKATVAGPSDKPVCASDGPVWKKILGRNQE